MELCHYIVSHNRKWNKIIFLLYYLNICHILHVTKEVMNTSSCTPVGHISQTNKITYLSIKIFHIRPLRNKLQAQAFAISYLLFIIYFIDFYLLSLLPISVFL